MQLADTNTKFCWGVQAGLKPGGVFILKENQAREGELHTHITSHMTRFVIVK